MTAWVLWTVRCDCGHEGLAFAPGDTKRDHGLTCPKCQEKTATVRQAHDGDIPVYGPGGGIQCVVGALRPW